MLHLKRNGAVTLPIGCKPGCVGSLLQREMVLITDKVPTDWLKPFETKQHQATMFKSLVHQAQYLHKFLKKKPAAF